MTNQEINALMIEAEQTGGEVMQLAMGAQENAHTTVYEEKSESEANLADLTLRSLQGLLSYSDDAAAVAWFVARGVVF